MAARAVLFALEAQDAERFLACQDERPRGHLHRQSVDRGQRKPEPGASSDQKQLSLDVLVGPTRAGKVGPVQAVNLTREGWSASQLSRPRRPTLPTGGVGP